MRPYLSIVIPSYNDYDGLFFTLTHAYNTLKDVEFIVVDSSTLSSQRSAHKALCENINVRYERYTGPAGTAITKEFAISKASGEYVMCVDSHVLIYTDLDYLKEHLAPNNIYHGILLHSDGSVQADCLKPSEGYSTILGVWDISDTYLNSDVDNYDIPMAGMGLFIVHKDTWRGFNEKFRGFGFEEYYIHRKYLNSGGGVKCLRNLEWIHRFRKAGIHGNLGKGVKDQIIENYKIGLKELGDDKMLTKVLGFTATKRRANRRFRL